MQKPIIELTPPTPISADPPSTPPDPLQSMTLTCRAVAEATGYKEWIIHQAAKDGEIPATQNGPRGTWRFKGADLPKIRDGLDRRAARNSPANRASAGGHARARKLEREATEKRLAEFQSQIDALANMIEQAKTVQPSRLYNAPEVARLGDDVQAIRVAMQNGQATLREVAAAAADLATKVKDLRTDLTVTRRMTTGHDDRLADYENRLAGLVDVLTRHTSEIARLEGTIQEAVRTAELASKLESRAIEQGQQIRTLQTTVAHLNKRITDMEQSGGSMHVSGVAGLVDRMNELDTQIQEVDADVEFLFNHVEVDRYGDPDEDEDPGGVDNEPEVNEGD